MLKQQKKVRKNTKAKKTNKFKSTKFRLGMFIVLFALVGAYIVYRSFASTGVLTGSEGEFTALTPARILDTRDGNGGFRSPVGPGQTISVQINGRGGVPASNVRAVVVNVIAVNPTASGYLTVWPGLTARPNSSNVNFTPGQVIPNQVTVPVGTDGKVQILNSAGNTHVVLDVAGYYATKDGTPGARYNTLVPARILDTRNGIGGFRQTVGPGQTIAVQVAGLGGIPAGNVRAVVMNVTVVNPTASGYMTIWQSGVARPNASNLNFTPGQVISNQVTVPVGTDGKVQILNSAGNTHVLFDVTGYYANELPGYEDSQAGRFVPVAQKRVYDSRTSGFAFGPGSTNQFGLNRMENLPVNGRVEAVSLSITAVTPTANGFLTVWPAGATRPITSNLNFGPGTVVSNSVNTQPGGDSHSILNIFNSAGNTHVVVDFAGYFLSGSDLAVGSESFFLGRGNAIGTTFQYDYTPVSFLETSISDSAPRTNIAPQSGGDENPGSDRLNPQISFKKGQPPVISFYLSNSRNSQTEILAPNGVYRKEKYETYIDVPYGFIAGRAYRFTHDIQTDAPSYSGVWEIVKVTDTTTNVTTPLAKLYRGPKSSTTSKTAYSSNVLVSSGAFMSCKNTTKPYHIRISNIKVGGVSVPMDFRTASGNSSIECPGMTRIKYVQSNSGTIDTILGVVSGKDLTKPTSSLSQSGKTVTVKASDNIGVKIVDATLNGTRVPQVYPSALGVGGNSFLYDLPSASVTFNLGSYAAGTYTFRYLVYDTSNNVVEKTQTITL